MMSTFTGLVVGVVTAAAVTVLYGDELQRRVRDLVQVDLPAAGRQASATLTSAMLTGSITPVGEDAAAGSAIAPVVTVTGKAGDVYAADTPPVAPDQRETAQLLPAVTGQDKPTLERRWAEYASGASSLTPAGQFPHHACFARAAAATGVPETLLLAVARGESNFNSAARSDKDAIGLMQIRWPVTGHHLGIRREADLYDPCTNVDAGARYLAELSERYDGDLHRVMGAYNYGPGRITAGPMPEGARWYSQYIFQHLQSVLGQSHVASSELLAGRPGSEGGYKVLMTFNRDYRAREFLQYLQAQAPGVELAQRSERLGLHEVVLLYGSHEDLELGRQMLGATGLVALQTGSNAVKTL